MIWMDETNLVQASEVWIGSLCALLESCETIVSALVKRNSPSLYSVKREMANLVFEKISEA